MAPQKPSRLAPVLIGGAVIGIPSALPYLEYLNCACCALAVGGGVLAAYLYLRDYSALLPPMSYGEGSWLGLQTGLVGSVIYTLVAVPLEYVKMRTGHENFFDLSWLDKVLTDPDIPLEAKGLVQGLTEEGLMTFTFGVAFLLLNFVIYSLFGALGGILGVAIFQKKTTAINGSGSGVYGHTTGVAFHRGQPTGTMIVSARKPEKRWNGQSSSGFFFRAGENAVNRGETSAAGVDLNEQEKIAKRID